MMNNIEKLTELFSRFPGIGPRQAARFVFFLLSQSKVWRADFLKTISELDATVSQCKKCMRFFQMNRNEELCKICSNRARNSAILMIVEKDSDIDVVEKSGAYPGLYFVLGGVKRLVGKNKNSKIRLEELVKYFKKITTDNSIKELIIALSATPDGEHTTDLIKQALSDICREHNIVVTEPGRGLSTGTEIEYADSDTLRNALKNRA